MPDPLTERQTEALNFIREYITADRDRRPPTMAEIGTRMGIRSPNAVSKLLKALEKKGYIERERHAARGLRLVEAERDPFSLDDAVPNITLVSRTSSEAPEQLRARPSGSLPIPPYFLGRRDPDACLLGRAGDDGMNASGIFRGDFLLIEETPREDLKNGDLAAALVRDNLIARHYDFVNGRIHLRPSARSYTEETFPPGDPACHLIGPVLAVFRKL